jgi:centrosomal CEP192-like protein/HYDIN/CFA65/VesB family protein
MLWPSRFNPATNERVCLALMLGLMATAGCADRAATDPRLTPRDRASLSVSGSPLDDLWISPHVVESGDTITGAITLAAPAPPGGAHIIVKSMQPLYTAIDSDLVVPEGATSKTFPIITYATPIDVSVGVYADWGAAHLSTYFVVKQVLPWRPLPIINIAPNFATFGAQALGTTSPPQVLTVRNIGTAPLTLGVISTSGPFTQTNTCASTLAPNESCTVSVRYVPTAAGSQSGQLLVPGNSQGIPPLVTLSGTGFVAVPALSLTPTSIAFGSVQLDRATAGKVVTITSTGNSPLVVSSLTIGGANPSDFWIVADNCTGASLNPGAACTASVSFEPTRVGARSATLAISHNASGAPSAVSLSGTGAQRAGGGWIP